MMNFILGKSCFNSTGKLLDWISSNNCLSSNILTYLTYLPPTSRLCMNCIWNIMFCMYDCLYSIIFPLLLPFLAIVGWQLFGLPGFEFKDCVVIQHNIQSYCPDEVGLGPCKFDMLPIQVMPTFNLIQVSYSLSLFHIQIN